MKIYKVSRTDRIGWDEFDSFVCIAQTEEDARKLHPTDDGETCDDWDDRHGGNGWVSLEDISKLKVEYIGRTEASSPRVVLASFNAG